MKVAKVRKKTKETKLEKEETYSIKSMVKILMVLLIIFGAFYFVTTLLVKNRGMEEEKPISVIDSSKIILSQLLNRNEEEYYVLATKSSLYQGSYVEINYTEFYSNYINEYIQEKDALTFYYVDLDSALNKKYFDEELNITEDLSKLKLNDELLFKINDGKIEKTYVGKDKILDKLSRL